MRLIIINTTSVPFYQHIQCLYLCCGRDVVYKTNAATPGQPLYCRHVASTEALAEPQPPGPAKCARLDGDLSTPDMLLTLATSPRYEEMYPPPRFRQQSHLLPVGTDTVERSFTTLNRILTSERSMPSRSQLINSDTSCFSQLKGHIYLRVEVPGSSRMPFLNSL
jgi:hypothetical protein